MNDYIESDEDSENGDNDFDDNFIQISPFYKDKDVENIFQNNVIFFHHEYLIYIYIYIYNG